jgi:hypothetical protein
MIVTILASSLSAADRGPATAPSTRPGAADVASIQALVGQLAEGGYETRESARVALMGLKRSQLELLREAVKQSLPLAPGQVAVLHDIVTQVYLTGDIYESVDASPGFLGVSLPSVYRAEDRGLLSLERGVAVVARVPGFCAYRMLQNGDVILSMRPLRGQPIRFETPDPDLLMESVKAVRAGQTITFEVLRQGQVINVPITLDPRPAGLDRNPATSALWFQEFTARRADQAEELWERDFAPLLADKVG